MKIMMMEISFLVELGMVGSLAGLFTQPWPPWGAVANQSLIPLSKRLGRSGPPL